MSRAIIYTPNEEQMERERRVHSQLRLMLTNFRGTAVDLCPINAPWTLLHTKAAPPTGAILWNGYGGEFALQLVAYLKSANIPFFRVEQGWFPQHEHCYFSEELGALSSLCREIENKQWEVDWDEHNAWLAQQPVQPSPGLPEGYTLVCGQTALSGPSRGLHPGVRADAP
jgi:hypothetical protein